MADEEKTERRARGTGSVYFDANAGLYAARVEALDPVSGELRTKKIRRKSKEDAEAVLAEMLVKRDRGENLATTDMRLGEWLDLWWERYSKAPTPNGHTAQEAQCRLYIKPSIGSVRLRSLTMDDVERLHTYVIDTKGLSSTTARQAHIVLRSALKDCKRRRIISENVAADVDLPLAAITAMDALTAKQARKLLRFTAEDRLAARWGLGLLALRQGEALGVVIDAVKFEKKRAYLEVSHQLQRIPWKHGCGPTNSKGEFECGRKRGTDCPGKRIDVRRGWEHEQLGNLGLFLTRPKSRAGIRTVPLVPPFRSMIEARIEAAGREPNPYGLLFTQDAKKVQNKAERLPLDGSPINPAADWRSLQDILLRAGLPEVPVHSLRHSTVELLYQLEIPEKIIIEIVGHSVVRTTRAYARRDRELHDKAMKKHGKKLSK